MTLTDSEVPCVGFFMLFIEGSGCGGQTNELPLCGVDPAEHKC